MIETPEGRFQLGIGDRIMGLFDKLRNELVDIIEWVDNTNRTLVWRFPRYQNEIKNGAQLIVRPGQKADLCLPRAIGRCLRARQLPTANRKPAHPEHAAGLEVRVQQPVQV